MDLWPAPRRWRPAIDQVRRAVVVIGGLVALAALVAHHGLVLSGEWARRVELGYEVAVGALVVELILTAWITPRFSSFLRSRIAPLLLLLLVGIQLAVLRFGGVGRDRILAHLDLGTLAQAYVAVLQFGVLGGLLLTLARANRRLSTKRLAPGRTVFGLFLILIVAGSLALQLPRVTTDREGLSWLDAAFTATSAVCVTGLTVVDVSADLTSTGQGMVLVLIQLGGLGIMALTGFLAVATGLRLGIRERAVLADVLHTEVVSQVGRHLRTIVVLTFIVEAVGALLLWRPMAELYPGRDAFGLAVFHSISAFCNAGFSNLPGNLTSAANSLRINVVVMLLIMLGGLGVTTLTSTALWIRARRGRRHVHLRVTTRLVWITSAGLWLGGFALLSVTARTAGFNTVDIATFSGPALLMLMVWMFVGGAPGSTAGGIKVTTLAVMGGVVSNIFTGKQRVTVAGREVHDASIREAIVVVFVGGLAAVVGLGVLLAVEPLPFLPLAFESISALGTTGLSMGATTQLSAVGKVAIMVLMFVGRLGPLTLVLAVGHGRAVAERYPTERVVVG
jgi:trk system potassium uptake protein TrkH